MLYRCYREEETHRVSGRKRSLGWALIYADVSDSSVLNTPYIWRFISGDTRLPFRRVNNLCVTCAFAVLRHEEVLLSVRESKKRHHLGAVILALRTLLNTICLLWLQFILIIEFAHHLYCLLPERQMIAYHKKFREMHRNVFATRFDMSILPHLGIL